MPSNRNIHKKYKCCHFFKMIKIVENFLDWNFFCTEIRPSKESFDTVLSPMITHGTIVFINSTFSDGSVVDITTMLGDLKKNCGLPRISEL